MKGNRNTYRKHVRLPEYDYRLPGAYFITVCDRGKHSLFGSVRDQSMELNEFGLIVQDEWLRTSEVRSNVGLDAFVVMPNHFHGNLVISDFPQHTEGCARGEATHRVAATGVRPGAASGPRKGSVGAIIGQFKSRTTKRINRRSGTRGESVWQQNYHEHIIRSDASLDRIRDYIEGNPARWAEDRYFVAEGVLA